MQIRCYHYGKLQQVSDRRPVREQALYLLKELGFDTTVLQGSEQANLPLDDAVVVHNLKQQLAKLLKEQHSIGLSRGFLRRW